MAKTYLAFANGSEFMYWLETNCSLCVKGSVDAAACDLQATLLDMGDNGDGKIKHKLAIRIGIPDWNVENGILPCKEFVAKKVDQILQKGLDHGK